MFLEECGTNLHCAQHTLIQGIYWGTYNTAGEEGGLDDKIATQVFRASVIKVSPAIFPQSLLSIIISRLFHIRPVSVLQPVWSRQTSWQAMVLYTRSITSYSHLVWEVTGTLQCINNKANSKEYTDHDHSATFSLL